jgi:hypothetical protein
LCALSHRANSHQILCDHSILRLKYLINFKSYPQIHGSLNQYLRTNQHCFQNQDIHHHKTRNRSGIHSFLNFSVRNLDHSVLYKSKLIYNNHSTVPEDIKKIFNKYQFKKNEKTLFKFHFVFLI